MLEYKFDGNQYEQKSLTFSATITDSCMDLFLDVPSSVLPTLQTLYYNGDSAITLAMQSDDITIVNNPGLLCPQFVYSITTSPASPAASQIWLPSTFYADI